MPDEAAAGCLLVEAQNAEYILIEALSIDTTVFDTGVLGPTRQNPAPANGVGVESGDILGG